MIRLFQFLYKLLSEGARTRWRITDVPGCVHQGAAFRFGQKGRECGAGSDEIRQWVWRSAADGSPGLHTELAEMLVNGLAVSASARGGHQYAFGGGEWPVGGEVALRGRSVNDELAENTLSGDEQLVAGEKCGGQDFAPVC
jgi:hypothetical protein